MFCPNCGTTINDQASFCAKCRKNVTYITQPAEGEAAELKRSGKQPDGFYCNHCGNFVLPDDNFCYSCGTKTQKKYYTKTLPIPADSKEALDAEYEAQPGNKKYKFLGVLLVVIVIGVIVGYYMSTQLS